MCILTMLGDARNIEWRLSSKNSFLVTKTLKFAGLHGLEVTFNPS